MMSEYSKLRKLLQKLCGFFGHRKVIKFSGRGEAWGCKRCHLDYYKANPFWNNHPNDTGREL